MPTAKYLDCPVFDMECPYCLASGECVLTYPEQECKFMKERRWNCDED